MAEPSVSTRACASLLLATLPNVMRCLASAARQQKLDDDDHPRMGQLHILGMLREGPRTLRELAALHHVTPSTMSRLVDGLVQKGWVARTSDPTDRRQVSLGLTDEGRAMLARMARALEDLASEFLTQLDDDQRTHLYDGLRALHAVMTRWHDSAEHCCVGEVTKGADSFTNTSPKMERRSLATGGAR